MDSDSKKMLDNLRRVKSVLATMTFHANLEKAFKETGTVANIQSAINGMLEEELLEMKIEQAKENKKKTGKFFIV